MTAAPLFAFSVMVLKPKFVPLPNAKFGVPLPTNASVTGVMALPITVKLPFSQSPRPPKRLLKATAVLSKVNEALGAT